MIPTKSPWLHELKRARPTTPLKEGEHTDIIVVGAGIAGIMTAFFLLQKTDKRVMVLEANKVAHGATGHNAGQIVSYFEKPFSEIVSEYGIDLAVRAQLSLYESWDLLADICTEAQLNTPVSSFTGYVGFTNWNTALPYLEGLALQKQAGLSIEQAMIAQDAPGIETLPPHIRAEAAIVTRAHIANILQTNDPHYIAAMAGKKGVTNSALLTEELVGYLIKTYHDRFVLHEHTPMERVELSDDGVRCIVRGGLAVAGAQVVLCTNGFEYFHIDNGGGVPIDTSFHENIRGKIGYMAAFLEPQGEPTSAVSYIDGKSTDGSDSYYYLTRRTYEYEPESIHNLVCIGGPELDIDKETIYHKDTHEYPERAKEEIDTFLSQAFSRPRNGDYAFLWHGLMGYTKTGLRMIGPDPRNNRLLYNLGCNGVGILPSIYGGKRIAEYVKFGVLDESVFDVRF
jgi:glycine/D-amino acid oxidase-like deaminating enzyme